MAGALTSDKGGSGLVTGLSEQGHGERQPVSSHDVIASLDVLSKLLEAVAKDGGASYTTRREMKYRRAREEVVTYLEQTACVPKLAKSTARLLPATLAEKCNEAHRYAWDPHGRQAIILLRRDIVSALERKGLLSERQELPGSATELPVPVTTHASATSPNRAQRRAVERREQARKLRQRGYAIKVIARALGCSERAVYTYLHDLP